MIALVRPPTAALVRCELTFRPREPIDVPLAEQQHAVFCDCLRSLGVTVVEVPAAPDLPDAVFVEDTAVVLDEVAVLTRPGAASRRPEVSAVSRVLSAYRKPTDIPPPGTLDGGDVLRVGRRLFVGRTSRTNREGVAGLRAIAEPRGYEVHEVTVQNCLHLLSACSEVGSETVLVNREWLDETALDGLRLVDVHHREPGAANTLRIDDTVLASASYPETRRRLEVEGLDVRAVDVSEIEKAEGGVSCLALLVST